MSGGRDEPVPRVPRRKWRAIGPRDPQLVYRWLMLPAALLVFVAYVVPIARVLVISVTEPGLGLENYGFILSSPAIRRVIGTTLRVATITSALALLLGYLLAYVLVALRARWQRLLLFAFQAAVDDQDDHDQQDHPDSNRHAPPHHHGVLIHRQPAARRLGTARLGPLRVARA